MVRLKGQAICREEVAEAIKKTNSAKDIYSLFSILNYPKGVLLPFPSKRKKTSFDLSQEEERKINEIYSILSFDEKLPVFLIESSTLSSSSLRYITKVFAEKYIRFLLILTTDYQQIVFVFPDYEKKETGSHKLKLTKLVLDKKEVHYTDIETLSNIFYTGDEASWRDVWKKWKGAFSVERVTINFFDDYKNIFFKLRENLNKQNISKKDSHEFTLQLLNRIMFIYFISKKEWLKYPKFIAWLWKVYLEHRNKGKSEKDSFYNVWLTQIFFNAFNNRASEITKLPEEVKTTISDFPFLNGGLFSKTDKDKLNVKISDELFKQVFEFFEKYNFTIKEDMPLESEVAVDPQMLGYVYESLANVAEEIYDRNDMGIFYTPRVEVDFMCRRSLVEYLAKQLPEIPNEKFYHLVFDSLEEKEKVEKYFQKEKFWTTLEEILDNLSVVDPACGSGAFLVGMLNVLSELYRIIYKYRKVELTDFQLKNRIVGKSLYGVDVMPWAIHAAELRLWLQLIIETEFKKDELRKHPLLPNLNMNLRIGDSLVQEIGGINLNLRSSDISNTSKKRLNSLKIEKQNYFNNTPTAKFKTKEELIKEEARIFEDIINARIEFIEDKIEEIKKTPKQMNLFGESSEDKETEEKRKARIDELLEEKSNLKGVLKNLGDPEKKPFVWDIDFAEIFGDKGGFDIVIGNPPYVRQEMISPPNRLKAEVTLEDRKEYKEKLVKSVHIQFSVLENIDKRSDYYIYFYFHGLGLLNEKGTFCFITSNSWLDAEYGKELQEFLLKYVPIIAIYDNPKRSFAHADVNTIITLFGAPQFETQKTLIFGGIKKGCWSNNNNIAKFVMFKKPFEEVMSTQSHIYIEDIKVNIQRAELAALVNNVISNNDYRVFPILQEDLLEDGWEYPEDYPKTNGRFKIGNYGGNKWGGKFLRVPDIFFRCVKSLQKNSIALSSLFEGERYLNTGGADGFFILSQVKKVNKEYSEVINDSKEGVDNDRPRFLIKNTYLKPLVKDLLKEDKRLEINKTDAWVLCITDAPKDIDSKTKEYIKWGEKTDFNKRSVTINQKPWYKPTRQMLRSGAILLPRSYNDSYTIYYNPHEFISLRFYRLYPKKPVNVLSILGILNSTYFGLFLEAYGAGSLGLGALDVTMASFLKIKIPFSQSFEKQLEMTFKKIMKRNIRPIFEELGIDGTKPIREQEPKPLPDRAELDKIIFDELEFTKEERKEVYWAVCELVKQRLEKARSLEAE